MGDVFVIIGDIKFQKLTLLTHVPIINESLYFLQHHKFTTSVRNDIWPPKMIN